MSASPRPPEPVFYTVFQARLDWVTLHSNAWSVGKLTALNRYSSLTGREAGELYTQLNHDYLELEQLLETWPNDSLEGKRWLELRTRLQRWKGMLAGLWDLMQRGSRKVPKTPEATPPDPTPKPASDSGAGAT